MDAHSPFGGLSTYNSSHNNSHNNSTSNLHLQNNPSTQSSATMVGAGGAGGVGVGVGGQGHHIHSTFTPEMRDKQARGKDPYAERSDEESDFEGENSVMGGGLMSGRSGAGGRGGLGMGRGGGRGGGGLAWGERRDVRRRVEISGNAKTHGSMSNSNNHHVDYDTLEKRHKASTFLNDPELLITHAEASGMTIAGSRHHFMLMLCGYDNQPQKKTGTHGTSSVSSGSSSRFHQAGSSGYNSRPGPSQNRTQNQNGSQNQNNNQNNNQNQNQHGSQNKNHNPNQNGTQNQNQSSQPQQPPQPDVATLIAQLSYELGQLDSTFVSNHNVP